MKKFITFSIIAGLAFTFAAFTSTNSSVENSSINTKVLNGDKTIVAIAAGNENFTTLVAAVKAAGLVDTLFAPVNDAFAKLPEGTVASLLKEENKATLTSILTYHVVSGKFMAADVVKAIKANNGEFKITTVQGGILTATLSGANVILTDSKGNKSTVVIADVNASNGVVHAIDTVVMP